ncbi:glycosyltransferase family 2 protein [Ornithobacterium rhinotracheale]|uniref:glycosyltransferase family 2 protein n=1 Tax=Ornithobacterium rhinotracheale TaxID=28251 RepID=UPI004036F074
MNTYDLSIIIPVYNVEKYLRRCLDSIYNQDASGLKFEVITINDGSPDNSFTIQQEYEKKHDNFKAILTENGGAGSARNRGLEVATGKYIWFVDADDFIEDNALKFIYKNAILKDQSIGFNYSKFDSENGKVPARVMLDNEAYSSKHRGLEYTYGNRSFFLWICILNRKVIKEAHIRFLEGVKNIEDFDFMMKYFSQNADMFFYNERLYCYNNDNQQSTSRNKSIQNLNKLADDSYTVHKELYRYNLKQKKLSYWLTKSIVGFFISLIKFYPKEDFDKYLKIYKQENLIPVNIDSRLNFKYKFFSFVLNNFPHALLIIKKCL